MTREETCEKRRVEGCDERRDQRRDARADNSCVTRDVTRVAKKDAAGNATESQRT